MRFMLPRELSTKRSMEEPIGCRAACPQERGKQRRSLSIRAILVPSIWARSEGPTSPRMEFTRASTAEMTGSKAMKAFPCNTRAFAFFGHRSSESSYWLCQCFYLQPACRNLQDDERRGDLVSGPFAWQGGHRHRSHGYQHNLCGGRQRRGQEHRWGRHVVRLPVWTGGRFSHCPRD